MKNVIIYTYDSATKEIRNKGASVKKYITETQQKLDTLEKRHSIGEIDKVIYTKFSEKFKLEKEIQNPEISSSNL